MKQSLNSCTNLVQKKRLFGFFQNIIPFQSFFLNTNTGIVQAGTAQHGISRHAPIHFRWSSIEFIQRLFLRAASFDNEDFDSNARKEDQEKCTFLAVAVLEKIYQTGDTSMWAKAMEILVYATSLKIEYAYTYLVKGDKFHPEKITLCELCVFW